MTSANFNAGLAYSDYKTRKTFYMLAAVVAFLMSSYFVVGYLAGNLQVWTWDASQWLNGLVGIGITGVMTGYQYILYSAGNMSQGKRATVIAVIVAVSFSLLSEVGQGMERDSIRMETKSQESPTYKAIVGVLAGSVGGASYNPYSTDLQDAQAKLAQCEARLARGKERHCEGSKARVAAVNQMIASHAAASQQQALALAHEAKSMERDEKNYHPLVSVIREFFGATGTIASFMVSLTIISFFEYAFHYLGGQFAAAREYLMQHGYDVTRRLRQPPRKFDGSLSTYAPANAFVSGLKASPEIIAAEYARAQNAREQMAAKTGDALKAIGDKAESFFSDAPEIKPASGFKQSRDQAANVNKLYQAEVKKHEAGTVFNESPTPSVKKMSVNETMLALVDAVKKSGAKTESDIKAVVFDAYAKLINPVDLDDRDLVNVSAKIAKKVTTPLPRTTPLGSQGSDYPATTPHYPATTPLGSQDSDYPATTQRGSQDSQEISGLYQEWLQLIKDRAIKPASEPFNAFVFKRTGLKGFGKDRLKAVWDSFCTRACNDGVLKLNPEYAEGNRKAKYLVN